MLIDTNIFLELALGQKHHKDCQNLLEIIHKEGLDEEAYITRFSLSAIEALTGKIGNDFLRELLLMIYTERLKIANLDIADDLMINSIRKDLDLDFDDAVQFTATNKIGTYLVTYDKDFKKTSLKTKTPKQVLQKILPQ